MVKALTSTTWDATLQYLVRNSPDPTIAILAAMLRDILHTIDDDRVIEILNAYGLYLMKQA